MRDLEPLKRGESGPRAGPAASEPEDGLTIEPLDPWRGSGGLAVAGKTPRARSRALRGGLVVALLAAVVFVTLNGPAATVAGWSWLREALATTPTVRPLAMTPWRVIAPPPAPTGDILTYTPDPLDPNQAFACASGIQDASIWATNNGGSTWRELFDAPQPVNSSCQIKYALDDTGVALAIISTASQRTPGCAGLTPYITRDGGATWTFISLPLIPEACLSDMWISNAALYEWWTNAQGGQAQTGLLRSADGGSTWSQVRVAPFDTGFSLAPALLDSGSANTVMTQVYYWPQPGQGAPRDDLWRSLDGGQSWSVSRDIPLSAQLISSTEPDALYGPRWPPAYAAVYDGGELTPPWQPQWEPASISALRPDSLTWSPLPPLPLRPSATPQTSPPLGITAPLAVGPGGSLLALGERPGAAATLNPQTALWLWAWDPAARRWRAGPEAPDSAALAGLTWSDGPPGSMYAGSPGAYLWLTGLRGGLPALFQAFIPATQPG